MSGTGQRRQRRNRPRENGDGEFSSKTSASRQMSERLQHIDELIQNALTPDSQRFLESFVQEGGE